MDTLVKLTNRHLTSGRQRHVVSFPLLDQFVPQENPGKETRIVVKRNPQLLRLEKLFLSTYDSAADQIGKNIKDGKSACDGLNDLYQKALWNQKFDLHTIEKFSLGIERFQSKRLFPDVAGTFLTAIIGLSDVKNVTLHLQHLGGRINYLCNCGKIMVIDGDVGENFASFSSGTCIVNGSVGDRAAWHFGVAFALFGDGLGVDSLTINGNAGSNFAGFAKNCTIVINGNCGDFLGYQLGAGAKITINGNCGCSAGNWMYNGEIIINGDCGPSAGYTLRGGIITINGNAGSDLGSDMNGGTIIVNGNIVSLAGNIRGGNIFQNGRQLVKNGRRIEQPINVC